MEEIERRLDYFGRSLGVEEGCIEGARKIVRELNREGERIDVFVAGRGVSVIAYCSRWKVKFEVMPGVTIAKLLDELGDCWIWGEVNAEEIKGLGGWAHGVR